MKKYYTVQNRRKRDQKTNYKKRLNMLKSGMDRLVVRVKNNSIVAQIVRFEPVGDKVLLTVNSNSLKKHGYNGHNSNCTTGYLIGLLVAKQAAKLNISEAIADLGLQLSQAGNRIYSVLKGVNDGGLNVPADESIFPSEERVNGNVISQYANSLDDETLKKRFSGLIKKGLDPKSFDKHVESVKAKIMEA